MTEAELRIVNSAITLGARMVPPVGSTVELYWLDQDGIQHLMVRGTLEKLWRDSVGHLLVEVYDTTAHMQDIRYVYPHVVIQLVSIPDDAPSFAEWERIDV